MKISIRTLFDYEAEKDHKIFSSIFLVILFLFGLLGWIVFLNFGKIPFDFHDWAEVNAPRLAFTKDAVTKGVLPLHMTDTFALRGVTDRFMALPDVILSPQIIFLRWMSVGTFVLVDTCFLLILGYWGLLKLRRKFSLSLISFVWIFLLFSFNGHILSHYSVGHVTWGGYFLFPWFVLLVLQLLDGQHGWAWTAKMAFFLFILFLQGSFHPFVWCIIFLGFLAITNPKHLLTILRTGIAAILLSAVRIIPPALQMNSFDDEFLGGYRTPIQLVKAFIQIVKPADSLNSTVTGTSLGWWEFDIFTGYAGLFFLLCCVIIAMIRSERKIYFGKLIGPLAILSFFSMRNFYQILRFFKIPLFSGERVSSRFLILPFVFVLIIGTGALQRWIHSSKRHRLWNFLLTIGLIPLIYELYRHLDAWKITKAFLAFPFTWTDLSIKVVGNHADPVYTNGLIIGAVLTGISSVLLIIFAIKNKG